MTALAVVSQAWSWACTQVLQLCPILYISALLAYNMSSDMETLPERACSSLINICLLSHIWIIHALHKLLGVVQGDQSIVMNSPDDDAASAQLLCTVTLGSAMNMSAESLCFA